MSNTQPVTSKQAPQNTSWAAACHISALAGCIFPFGSILAPFLIWTFRRNDSAFINTTGKNVLNFQISFLLLMLVWCAAGFFCFAIPFFIFFWGFGFAALMLFWLGAVIVGALKAINGELFVYPFTLLRILK